MGCVWVTCLRLTNSTTSDVPQTHPSPNNAKSFNLKYEGYKELNHVSINNYFFKTRTIKSMMKMITGFFLGQWRATFLPPRAKKDLWFWSQAASATEAKHSEQRYTCDIHFILLGGGGESESNMKVTGMCLYRRTRTGAFSVGIEKGIIKCAWDRKKPFFF